MRTITFEVPSYVDQPGTIADYAFAHAMQDTFGTIDQVVATLASELPTGHVDRVKAERACVAVDNYLSGISHGNVGTDPFSPVIEYMDGAEEVGADDVTWIMYVSDARDA